MMKRPGCRTRPYYVRRMAPTRPAAHGLRKHEGTFASAYTDEQFYELIRDVALALRVNEASDLAQRRFDAQAPATAAANDLPPPPKANAVYMRLGKPHGKSWLDLVEEALSDKGIKQMLRRQDGEEAAPWLDERYVHYALNRARKHL